MRVDAPDCRQSALGMGAVRQQAADYMRAQTLSIVNDACGLAALLGNERGKFFFAALPIATHVAYGRPWRLYAVFFRVSFNVGLRHFRSPWMGHGKVKRFDLAETVQALCFDRHARNVDLDELMTLSGLDQRPFVATQHGSVIYKKLLPEAFRRSQDFTASLRDIAKRVLQRSGLAPRQLVLRIAVFPVFQIRSDVQREFWRFAILSEAENCMVMRSGGLLAKLKGPQIFHSMTSPTQILDVLLKRFVVAALAFVQILIVEGQRCEQHMPRRERLGTKPHFPMTQPMHEAAFTVFSSASRKAARWGAQQLLTGRFACVFPCEWICRVNDFHHFSLYGCFLERGNCRALAQYRTRVVYCASQIFIALQSEVDLRFLLEAARFGSSQRSREPRKGSDRLLQTL